MRDDILIQIRSQLDALPPEERAQRVEDYKNLLEIISPTEVPFWSPEPKTSYHGTWQTDALDKK